MFFTVLMNTIKKIMMIMIGNSIKFNFRIAVHVPDDIYFVFLLVGNYTLYLIGFTLRCILL